MHITTPVLIVGAGPTGLSASIALARHGVRSLLVERHPGTSIDPSATGISVRTMELFRAWGIDHAARRGGRHARPGGSVLHTLAMPELTRLPLVATEQAQATSPVEAVICAKDHLESILLEHARGYLCTDLRFGTELVSVEQDDEGVSAAIVDRTSGERSIVRARYLIAADGASSPVRTSLGIRMIGSGAERFRDGRVLLCGAAAQRTTPSGAPGLNSAIPDAHNLAWKIAAVEQGWAEASLLDTFQEAERRPVAEGHVARSPDLRAPHVWLELEGRPVSTLDLGNERFVLLSGDGTAGDVWAACGWSAARDLGVPFVAFTIGPEGNLQDRAAAWHVAFGVEPGGAVLIRPDGHIGWRSRGAVSNPIGAIANALSGMLGTQTGDRGSMASALGAHEGHNGEAGENPARSRHCE